MAHKMPINSSIKLRQINWKIKREKTATRNFCTFKGATRETHFFGEFSAVGKSLKNREANQKSSEAQSTSEIPNERESDQCARDIIIDCFFFYQFSVFALASNQ